MFCRYNEEKRRLLMTHLQYIFCHGLSGWGEYDRQYKRFPYWGTPNGDLMVHLRSLGYDCHAASVSPKGSAWDRACELYAQLAGTVTDYGRMHAEACHHARYGKDFRDQPLIPEWNEDTRIVLLGHSFGGATVRLLAQLLAEGDEKEREGTHPLDISPLFAGGMADRLAAVVTLAAPTNGTTAYDLFNDPNFDVHAVRIPLKYELLNRLMSLNNRMEKDEKDPRDCAAYDMEIDHAFALNEGIHLQPHVYYFSIACNSTAEQADGTYLPDEKKTDGMFMRSSILMGSYKGFTAGGREIDESWRANDGLVNVKSARFPLNDPHKDFDADDIQPGIWNVLPDYDGDHASLQGGFLVKSDPTAFYEELLVNIERLFSE